MYNQLNVGAKMKVTRKTAGRIKPTRILLVVTIICLIVLAGSLVWFLGNGPAARPKNEAESTNMQAYLVLKEWGVKFKLDNGLSDVMYFEPRVSSDNHAFTFTTEELATKWPGCNSSSSDIVLGLLSRNTTEDPQAGQTIAKINNFYYQYRGPQATCSEDPTTESHILHLLIDSLKSLQAL